MGLVHSWYQMPFSAQLVLIYDCFPAHFLEFH